MVMHGSPLPSTHVVGSDDGWTVGELLGAADGCADRCAEGCGVGSADGNVVGDMLGSWKHSTNDTPSTTAAFGIRASSLAMIAALFEFA